MLDYVTEITSIVDFFPEWAQIIFLMIVSAFLLGIFVLIIVALIYCICLFFREKVEEICEEKVMQMFDCYDEDLLSKISCLHNKKKETIVRM